MMYNHRIAKNDRGAVNRKTLLVGAVALPLAWGLPGVAAAGEQVQVGDVTITENGVATVGTDIRSSPQNPALLPVANAKSIGLVGTAVKGMNQADGDLNYRVGSPVSSVVKGLFSVDAHTSDYGAFVSARTWFDWTQAETGVPFGNIPNYYTRGQPLGEAGFYPEAQSLNIVLLDAYLYGKYQVSGMNGEIRAGNQIVQWGLNTSILGGLLTSINGIDPNAAVRPGALPQEVLNREPAVSTKLAVTDKIDAEAFYRFLPSVNTPFACGTFFAVNDYAQPGCDYVLAGPATMTNAQQIAAGYTYRRADTPTFHDPQFGLGGSYLADAIHTKFGVYYAHVDDTQFLPGVVTTTRSLATPFIPSVVPSVYVKNPEYFIQNPPNSSVVALNFTTKLNLTTIYGEATIKPDSPLAYNASDMISAFGSATAPTLLRAQATALGAHGATFNGYERFNQAQYDLGVKQDIPDILGAQALQLTGEGALKSVYGLPSVNVARFGRADIYGIGPVNGVCTTTAGETAAMVALQCSNNGYVTSNAWGYRLNASLQYANVFTSGLNVTPSVGLAQDVSGWSGDQAFNQGRLLLNLGLLFNYNTRFFGGITWNPVLHAAPYDQDSDRQVYTVYAGIKF